MADPVLSEGWEKAKMASQVLATLLMPLILLFVGHTLSGALKEREAGTKFIELAISILREEPQPEDTPLREWALEVIDRYSEIKLEDGTRDALLADLPLPRLRNSVSLTESFYLPVGHELPLAYLRGSIRLQSVDRDGEVHVSISPWSESDLVIHRVGGTALFEALGRTYVVMLDSVSQTDQTASLLIFQKPKATRTIVVEDPIFAEDDPRSDQGSGA